MEKWGTIVTISTPTEINARETIFLCKTLRRNGEMANFNMLCNRDHCLGRSLLGKLKPAHEARFQLTIGILDFRPDCVSLADRVDFWAYECDLGGKRFFLIALLDFENGGFRNLFRVEFIQATSANNSQSLQIKDSGNRLPRVNEFARRVEYFYDRTTDLRFDRPVFKPQRGDLQSVFLQRSRQLIDFSLLLSLNT